MYNWNMPARQSWIDFLYISLLGLLGSNLCSICGISLNQCSKLSYCQSYCRWAVEVGLKYPWLYKEQHPRGDTVAAASLPSAAGWAPKLGQFSPISGLEHRYRRYLGMLKLREPTNGEYVNPPPRILRADGVEDDQDDFRDTQTSETMFSSPTWTHLNWYLKFCCAFRTKNVRHGFLA